jgi:hypothetical protein
LILTYFGRGTLSGGEEFWGYPQSSRVNVSEGAFSLVGKGAVKEKYVRPKPASVTKNE